MRNQIIAQLNSGDWLFDQLALDIYAYQSQNNPLYKEYLCLTGLSKKIVSAPNEIPFLPISFFKTHQVKTGKWKEVTTFSSSGTTGSVLAQHAVRDLDFYLRNAQQIFEKQYGTLRNYHVLGLLPGYLERKDSSLVAMVKYFMDQSQSNLNGFYLTDFAQLAKVLAQAKGSQKQTLLIGVSFGLLDFAEAYSELDLEHCIIMETGGMKGRRKEIIRAELHQDLKAAFNVQGIHSEYGMTELLSQAYAAFEGRYVPGQTMRVFLREFNDPFASRPCGKTGLMNIIDLANFDTCSFIATDDIGRTYQDGSFEVLGRFDQSDVRGCNLMVSDL